MPDIILDKFSQAAFREANEGRNSALAEVASLQDSIDRCTAMRDAAQVRADAYQADLDEFVAKVATEKGADPSVLKAERQDDNSYKLVDQDEKAAAEAAKP